MKDLLPWLLMAALAGSWLLDHHRSEPLTAASVVPAVAQVEPEVVPPGDPGEVFQLEDLMTQLEASGSNYLPFLNVPTLRTGLYALPAGATDGQQPHDKDEVYYVITGRANITTGEEVFAVQPGSVVFVAAHIDHRFHDITEDLQLLVFFSEAD